MTSIQIVNIAGNFGGVLIWWIGPYFGAWEAKTIT